MAPLISLLGRAFDFALLVLDRTGAAARLAALPLFPATLPLASRLAWALALAGAAVLLLYAALSAGKDRGVAAFRVVTLLAACLLPLLAARLVPAGLERGFGGAVLVLVFAAGLVHRALARRRRESAASRLLEGTRWLLEIAGIALCLAAAFAYFREGRVLGPAALWGLLCLRLSIADLLDPSRLARETGLTSSAAKDLKAARRAKIASGAPRAAPPHGPPEGRARSRLGLPASPRGRRARRGRARRMAAGGSSPRALSGRRALPTGLLLLVDAVKRLASNPFEAGRGALVGAATLLWLWLVFDRATVGQAVAVLPGTLRRRDARGLPLRRGRARALSLPT